MSHCNYIVGKEHMLIGMSDNKTIVANHDDDGDTKLDELLVLEPKEVKYCAQAVWSALM